jgi:hypothetical protein
VLEIGVIAVTLVVVDFLVGCAVGFWLCQIRLERQRDKFIRQTLAEVELQDEGPPA